MKQHIHFSRGRLLAVATVLFACIPFTSAYAQQWQNAYGCACGREAGRRGVAPVSEGGYIAVGETFSAVHAPDIYVVRTEDDGTLAWSYTYDVGDEDSATDVEEVLMKIEIPRYDTIMVGGIPFLVPNGTEVRWEFDGFIITGVTRFDSIPRPGPTPPPGGGGGGVRTDRDLFLLRIDRCGAVRWFKTYGTDSTDEIGYDLKVLGTGDSLYTHYQDIIVAGTSTRKSVNGTGPRDAYLLRTTRNGTIIWDRTYDINSAGKDDYFYGVTEALALRPANQPADIVAVGGTYALDSTSTDVDALIVRVDGANGRMTAVRHNTVIYTAPDDEDLRAVSELTLNPHAGELAVIGRTLSFDNGSSDIFVMTTTTDPGVPLQQHIYGEIDEEDEGYDLMEVRNAPYYDRGNLVITGYVTPNGGLGDKDAFLQKLDPMNLNPIGMMHIYGDTAADWGWSLHPVASRTQDSNLCSTDGYIMCGFTRSDLANTGDTRQMYIVRTNTNLVSGCFEDSLDIPHDDIAMDWTEVEPHYDSIRLVYEPTITKTCRDWYDSLCLDLEGTMPCPIPFCPNCEPGPDPEDTNKHIERRVAPGMTELVTGTLTTYPNPVRRGSIFHLRTNLAEETSIVVTVVDLAGREVYRTSDRYGAGTALVALDTRTWTAGSYVVTLSGGGRSASARFIVVDR